MLDVAERPAGLVEVDRQSRIGQPCDEGEEPSNSKGQERGVPGLLSGSAENREDSSPTIPPIAIDVASRSVSFSGFSLMRSSKVIVQSIPKPGDQIPRCVRVCSRKAVLGIDIRANGGQ